MKIVFISLFYFLCTTITLPLQAQNITYQDPGKQRVIVLTDITNEPDDQQSLVRFLVYVNEYDVEGIVATTSVHLRNKVRRDKIEDLIEAYGKVKPNLDKHAPGFPASAYLKGITKEHLPLYGMAGVGEGKDSDGSELIIRSADKADDRPLWISVWGGANCLAQALWKVKATRSPEAVKRFVEKLKVYTISDQDDAGPWIRAHFPGIFYIVNPSAESWLEYYRATWTGISGDRHYKNAPLYKFELVDNPWLEENIIKNHGPLGALYPKLEYIMEGDTPSFIGLINNGLGSSISPAYGGWSGRYDYFQPYGEKSKIWTSTINSVDEVTLEDGKTYASDQATIWRWREAFQHDFATRIDWCIAGRVTEANHNPVISINGNQSKAIGFIKAKAGETVKLSASGSKDPDGNKIAYKWFLYKEAGYFKGNLAISNIGEEVAFKMPALKEGESLHLICEGKDDGRPALYSYRRIIISH